MKKLSLSNVAIAIIAILLTQSCSKDVSVITLKLRAVGCAAGVTQGVLDVEVIVRLSILIFGLDPVVPPTPL